MDRLDAYEKALTEIARRLAASDNAAEAQVGMRLLRCVTSNYRVLDRPCSNCETPVVR